MCVCVSHCQRVFLEKVILRPGSVALQPAGALMTMIVPDLRCIPRFSLSSSDLSILPEWLSDVIHGAYVTHLQIVISEGERKRCKRVPGRMRRDIRGVSPTSGGARHPNHLPVLLLFPRSPAVREELVSAPIKGKMPILHRVSEQPQSINQPGGTETDIMCLSRCLCVSAHVLQSLIQVGVIQPFL